MFHALQLDLLYEITPLDSSLEDTSDIPVQSLEKLGCEEWSSRWYRTVHSPGLTPYDPFIRNRKPAVESACIDSNSSFNLVSVDVLSDLFLGLKASDVDQFFHLFLLIPGFQFSLDHIDIPFFVLGDQ